MTLFEKALSVRQNAHAPYSNFKVGAALRTQSGKEFVGCNVENAAYPEGTCAEAGAIAAMVAAGESRIEEIWVVQFHRDRGSLWRLSAEARRVFISGHSGRSRRSRRRTGKADGCPTASRFFFRRAFTLKYEHLQHSCQG